MQTLDELLQKPEEKFNLGEAALVLAAEVPELAGRFDVQVYLAKLDQMAADIRPRIAGKSPGQIISELNGYIFEEEKFKVEEHKDDKEHYPSHFLNVLLDRKKGCCTGLSLLYIALGERLNLPLYVVLAPKHVFVRWDDNKTTINIETLEQGWPFTNNEYIRNFNINKVSIENKVFLKNLDKKEALMALLAEIEMMKGFIKCDSEDYIGALENFSKAIEYEPNYHAAYTNRGGSKAMLDDYKGALDDLEKALKLNPNDAYAYHGIGEIKFELGDCAGAIDAWQRELVLDDSSKGEIQSKIASARQKLLGKG